MSDQQRIHLTASVITMLLIIFGILGVYSLPNKVPNLELTHVQSSREVVLNQNMTPQRVYENMQLTKRLNEEKFSHSFLPFRPAAASDYDRSHELDIPLLLQNDPQWKKLKYGDDESNELGDNGCAIVSLAMTRSYLDQQMTSPEEILQWSKENYYVQHEGTSWEIFFDFAEKYGYDYFDFGDNFDEAMKALNDDKVIIASVEPGYFTENGHIIVIRGYKDGLVYVNDPGDNGRNQFSTHGIDEAIIRDKGINFWSFSK